jgi:hypothetical protein
VASPHCTVAFVLSMRCLSEFANSESISMHAILLLLRRNLPVVRPGPSPTSRTSTPKATPLSDQGRLHSRVVLVDVVQHARSRAQ